MDVVELSDLILFVMGDLGCKFRIGYVFVYFYCENYMKLVVSLICFYD